MFNTKFRFWANTSLAIVYTIVAGSAAAAVGAFFAFLAGNALVELIRESKGKSA